MPYMIDGHNLIPKLTGLSLHEIDDEVQLIQLLQDYCQHQQKEVEVYFDNGPAGQPRARRYGLVTAHFVRAGVLADDAIAARLRRLAGEARNWTVVSSDHVVQASAHAAHARVLSSEVFARQMEQAMDDSRIDPTTKKDAALSDSELDEWLDLFNGNPDP
jgi:uncharacterized protein